MIRRRTTPRRRPEDLRQCSNEKCRREFFDSWKQHPNCPACGSPSPWKPKRRKALWTQLHAAKLSKPQSLLKAPQKLRKAQQQAPRKRVRPVSKHRAQRLRQYRQQKAAWLREHQTCVAGMNPALEPCYGPLDLHHFFGRQGSLLMDSRGWVCLCRKHHDFVHQNIAQARKLKLIAEIGSWNKPIK